MSCIVFLTPSPIPAGVSHLPQIQGDVDLVVPCARGEGGALPPVLRPVDGVGDWMGFPGVLGVAVVAELPLEKDKTTQKQLFLMCK